MSASFEPDSSTYCCSPLFMQERKFSHEAFALSVIHHRRQATGAQTTVQQSGHSFAYTLLTRKVSASPSSGSPHPAAFVQRDDPLRTGIVVFESVGTQVADLEFGEAATEVRKRHPAQTDRQCRLSARNSSVV